MATEVILPRVDMDMAEGKIAHWYVKDGEAVKKGQLLFEIETDKATMEVDSPVNGVMHGIHNEIGVDIPVGQVIGWILAPGEAPPATGAVLGSAESEKPIEAAAFLEAGSADSQSKAAPTTAPAAGIDRLLRATPLARNLARQQGVDLAKIIGSGPDGRVLGRDLTGATAASASDVTASSHEQEINLKWARRGRGTPLLLIHGFGADLGSWKPLIQQLAESLPVVGVDLPNHGKSGPRSIGTLQEIAHLVLSRLDHEGIGDLHLLGHSLGGGVALAVSQIAPQRVRSLTLLAPVGLGSDMNADFIDGLLSASDEAALKAAMAPLFHDPSGLTGSFVATAFQQLQVPERRSLLAAMSHKLMPLGRQSQSLRDVLQGLRVPVQLVWGNSDRIIPRHHAQDVPLHVGVHLLPSVGHLPQVEAAPLVAALVSHQLRSLSEST